MIIPIFNTGRYLDDSFGSILNQTINFESIQVILVNDGSIDQTEEICLHYGYKFPKNIIYRSIILNIYINNILLYIIKCNTQE